MNDPTEKLFVMDFWMKGLRFRDELNTKCSLILLHIKYCLFGLYTCTLIFIKCTTHISIYNNELKKIQNNSPLMYFQAFVDAKENISVFALCFFITYSSYYKYEINFTTR